MDDDGFACRTAVAVLAVCMLLAGDSSPVAAQEDEPSESSAQPAESDEKTAEGAGEEKTEDEDSESGAESREPSESTSKTDSEGDDPEEPPSKTSGDSEEESASTETEVEGTSYELQELLRRAKTNEDLLDQFEAERDAAEWKQYQAKWANAPKIRSQTTLAPVPADADPDQIQRNYDEIAALDVGPFIQEDLNLIVPVFTFGRIRTLRELSEVGVDVADLKRREAQLNAVFQTKRAFYSLQLSRAFGPTLRKGDEKIEERLQEMEDARDFGTADFETKDFRKLQIFAAEVDSRISDNEKLATISSSGLKTLADLEADRLNVGKLSTDEKLQELEDFQTYLGAAERNRPELRQLQSALRARKLQVRLEKRKLYPNIFVAGKFRWGWSTKTTALKRVCRRDGDSGSCQNTGTETDGPELWARPENTPFNRFSIGFALGMRWNIDPIIQHGKIQEKQAKLRKLRAQRRRAKKAIRVELRKKFETAADQLRKVNINEERLDAARKWRNQLGLTMETAGKKLDETSGAVKPLKKYYKAKAKYLEARYRYKVARAALAQSVGVEHLRTVEQRAGDDSEEDGAAGASTSERPKNE